MAPGDFTTRLEFDAAWDDEPFTMVPTVWARLNLHWEDMGFLFWLRTHRKGFTFTEEFMVKATPGGRDKLRTILKRLEKAGVLERRKDRDPHTKRITGVTFIVRFPSFKTSGQKPENPSSAPEQGEQGVSAGEPDDGFSVDGKPVLGPGPGQTVIHRDELTTGFPSSAPDQVKHHATAGQPNDGKAYDGKAYDGKSATKKDQYKETPTEGKPLLLPGDAPNAPAPGGAEPDGSGSSSGSSPDSGQAAVALLRDAVDREAARRLTAREVDRLTGRVAALLASGVHAADLQAQLGPVTSSTTTHPFTRLWGRLDEITPDANPLTAPPSGGTNGIVIGVYGERLVTYRPCGNRDCTGGGNGATDRGGTPWRRRIDSDTGATDRLCDRLVTTRTGDRVTCHPDATPAPVGGS